MPSKVCGIPFPLTIFIVVTLIYAYFFGAPTLFVWRVKREAAKDPNLARVPASLSGTPISDSLGTTVVSFGYTFEVPWQGEVKIRNNALAFVASQSEEKIVDFLSPSGAQGVPNETRQFFGAHTDYDLERSTFYATPGQLSLIFPRRRAVMTAALLLTKPALETGSETGLYSFSIGQVRGFQFGDPARAKNVRVEAFDDQDHKLEFLFGSKSAENPALTQADINRVLRTLRRASALPQ